MRAMILAAGLGTRMGSLTKLVPKPLLKVANKPLIQYAIEHLIKDGVTDIIINSYYKSELMSEFFNKHKFSANIELIIEHELKDTGSGIASVIDFFKDEPFIVTSADVINDINYRSLYLLDGSTACMVMVDNPTFNPNGDYSINEGMLSYKEKNQDTYTYSNVGLFSKEFFNIKTSNYKPLKFYIDNAIKNHRINTIIHKGSWFNIGTLEQLEVCSKVVANKDYENIP